MTVLKLDDPAALDASIVGSKAANLASLRQAGFPALDGVVLAGLPLDPLPNGAGSPDPLDRIVELLGDGPLAIRSSAVAEDLAEASFAGQYESVLDVRGRAEISAALGTCLRSMQAERVRAYGDDCVDLGMAVLVQPMVKARAAGVAFSAHPVTGARDEVVINAVDGLATTMVAGEVTPEEWVVKGDTVVASPSNRAVLDAQEALELARLTRRVEDHFGRPQDTEWAIEHGSPVILQSRPITALPDAAVEPIPLRIDVLNGFWEHDASHFPNASYPIDSLVPDLVAKAARTWVTEFGYLFDGIEFRDIGGWTYQRLRPIGGREGPSLPPWILWLLVRVVPVMRGRIAVARDAVQSDKAGRYIERWHGEWLADLAATIRHLQAVDRSSLSDADLERHIDEVIGLATRGIEIHSLVHGSLAPIMYQFAQTCEKLLGWDLAAALRLLNGTSFKSTEPARRLHDLTRMAAKRPSLLEVCGLPDGEVVAGLERIDPSFAAAFTGYLAEYGHRALGGSCAEPTIAERPSLVLDMIRGQIETGFSPGEADAANRAARERALGEARRALTNAGAEVATFEHALERAVRAYPTREDNEFYTLSGPFALLRYVVIELGNRLAARGVISDRDDVLFLHLDEARAALSDRQDLRPVVGRRKGERAWAVMNPGPAFYGTASDAPSSVSFLPRDARLPTESMVWSLESMLAITASQAKRSDSSSIQGTPASAGSYTGPVRIIRDEREFDRLRPGDVLVCPITSPVWSILFASIGALITDSGGILSHPAIIAREHRVPAVVATGNATTLLHDSQRVTVDGSTGKVHIGEVG